MRGNIIKKLNAWIIVALFLVTGVLYYIFSDSRYEPVEEMYNFPVPIGARLIIKEETDIRKTYNWSPASFENGIPLSYKLVIKKSGWKQKDVEGSNVIYLKGSNQINLSTQTDYLSISKVE